MSNGVPMDLVGVRIELPSNQPIVLLRERGGTRYLPIWIGAIEATAIAYALEGVEHQRPLTHDLFRDSVIALGSAVDRVVVTELRDNVFFADLVFRTETDEIHVSARPSDAIALAARTEAPLFADAQVLEDAGIEIEEESEEDEIEAFREFLDDVSPTDFGAPPTP
ncbi:MAG: bifunctional nuclease family protein [Acidimicrobiia bacterium]|nr:bifunctional nuclease family protein [Acidimicrobiia bacterium]